MCITRCLDVTNMNTSLAAALTALGNGTSPSNALTTPFKDVGPWFKVACLLWIIEKRPFRFTSRMQIAICAIAGGLAFAVIENLLYQLRPEVRENPDIMQWRWTVCVALHVTCCLISSLGLMRTWNLSMTRKEKPNMATSAVFIMAAAILHGLYNLGCILFELKEKVF